MQRRNHRVGFGIAFVFLLGGLGAAVWAVRAPVWGWYCVRQLARAGDADRDVWVERIARQPEASLRWLAGCLKGPDSGACSNARAALIRVVAGWEPSDARRGRLAADLAEFFPEMAPAGQVIALEVAGSLLPDAVRAVGCLLRKSAEAGDAQVRRAGLGLAARCAGAAESAELLEACREVVLANLRQDGIETRRSAVELACAPGIDLLEAVVPLLRDPSASVRRAALLAVGSAPQVVAADDLLPCLHDPESDVRRVAELALRGRGLTDAQVKLGRLLADPRPDVRLQILECLRRDDECPPGAWLRRLSHDPSAAVRAGALRAVVETPDVDLNDRLEQVAQNDPSPTVRELARFYLACPKSK
jgi:hypothetical protein